ncbi:MAG: BamA/TamA family outer membrane protein [Deltaproteobacteria bacterium]|nr:BamA/TamA family outer membrane protein [Deltaproteobacteria bacterium]
MLVTRLGLALLFACFGLGCATLDHMGLFRSTVRADDLDGSGEVIPEEAISSLEDESTPAEAEVRDATGSEAAEEEEGKEPPARGEPFIAPIPFRSPQIGWGGALAGGYIFRIDPEDEQSPPSTVGGGAFGTENGSFGGVASFKGYLWEDLWRFSLTTAAFRVDYEYFGIGSDAGEEGFSVDLRSETFLLMLDALRRLPTERLGRFGERLFLGPVLEFKTSETELQHSFTLPPGFGFPSLDETQMSLGLRLQRDTRDDSFYPEAGTLSELTIQLFDDAFGGDDDYRIYDASLKRYHLLLPDTVAAWRVFSRFAEGDVPFTALPEHDLRGYERGRYRDKVHLAAEVELRQHIYKRLGGVAFAGLGQVAPKIGKLDTENILWSAGFGVRFRLTEENRMNYRSDVAWGRNGFEFYFSLSEEF